MMGIVSKASVTPVMQGRWLCQGNFQWTETVTYWKFGCRKWKSPLDPPNYLELDRRDKQMRPFFIGMHDPSNCWHRLLLGNSVESTIHTHCATTIGGCHLQEQADLKKTLLAYTLWNFQRTVLTMFVCNYVVCRPYVSTLPFYPAAPLQDK